MYSTFKIVVLLRKKSVYIYFSLAVDLDISSVFEGWYYFFSVLYFILWSILQKASSFLKLTTLKIFIFLQLLILKNFQPTEKLKVQ